MSSLVTVNSILNVRLLAIGLHSGAFLSLGILGSAIGSRGTVLTFEKCLLKASASFWSVSMSVLFTMRGSTRAVLPLPLTLRINCHAIFGSEEGFRFSHALFRPCDLAYLFYPPAESVIPLSVSDRFGL
ncbi:hypothetical protein PoB_003966400 [Plakobranchus ocellatus]|uniref:Secreted protein n=1 Tax=Plakobranchus ocellatus TaxID=259542 RepID=A0AAV4AZG9_9GAST|nr:hypothetical protein PoB_003966400 [Plakobranchus ocellatus]